VLHSFEQGNEPCLLEYLQVPAQVAVGQCAQLLQLAEGQALSMGDQRREHAQARMLVDHPVETIVGKWSVRCLVRSLVRFPSSTESPGQIVRRRRPAVARLQMEYPSPRATGSDARFRPRGRQDRCRYHRPTPNMGRGRKRHEAKIPRLKISSHRPGNIQAACGAALTNTPVSRMPATIAGRNCSTAAWVISFAKPSCALRAASRSPKRTCKRRVRPSQPRWREIRIRHVRRR